MKEYITKLKELNACSDALEGCKQFDTLEEARQKCERGDWMLWLAGKLSGPPDSDSRKKVVLVACQCARLALKYVQSGEVRPLTAIETAEAWARGEGNITLAEVRDAAYAAAYAAYNAAAYAAYAAYAAAHTRKKTLKKCADIVREYYPTAPELKDG